MSTVPDRKTLEGMKRIDLQKLCKERGLRANLKSESLIDLLLEATKPESSSQLPRPTRSSSMRIISKSSSGTRQRGFSGSSVIIHDTDEEEETEEPPAPAATSSQPQPPQPQPTLPPAPGRAPRKAKESQYKLGVGRPTLAGGSGARAVTRTGSISKPRRGKAPSTSVKPNEEAIQEVDEEMESPPAPSSEPQAGPSGTSHDDPIPAHPATSLATPNLPAQLPVANLDGLRATIEELILPIRDQMQTLNTNFDEVARNAAEASSLRSQITLLTNEVATLRIQATRSLQLEAEVNMLKEHIAAMREMSSLASSHTRTESGETSGKAPAMLGSTSLLLGKRQRSPNDSNSIGVPEGDQEVIVDENAADGIVRPSKKRMKMSENSAGSRSSRGGSAQPRTPPGQLGGPSGAAEQGFTVYNGPEVEDYEESAPPTTLLSQLFATPGVSGSVGTAPSTSANPPSIPTNAAFTFTFPDPAFQPITSTPVVNLGVGPIPTTTSVPHPEPPTSPTPSPERARRGQAYASPMRSPVRSRPGGSQLPPLPTGSAPAGSSSQLDPSNPEQPPQFISPARLLRTPEPHSAAEASSSFNSWNSKNPSSLGIGIGRPRSSGVGTAPVALPLPLPPDTPAPPMKRTMYGTELDADSRFGDFGQDGVAMGFWTGVTPRF